MKIDSFTHSYIEAMLWAECLPKYGECPCCGKMAILDRFPEPEFAQEPMCSSEGCGVRELNSEPPADQNYGPDDFSEDAIKAIEKDCRDFLDKAGDLICQDNLEKRGNPWHQAGHDFWLTRSGHGAGFWDGDWKDDAGKKLTEIAESFGHVWIYVGDDGKIYMS